MTRNRDKARHRRQSIQISESVFPWREQLATIAAPIGDGTVVWSASIDDEPLVMARCEAGVVSDLLLEPPGGERFMGAVSSCLEKEREVLDPGGALCRPLRTGSEVTGCLLFVPSPDAPDHWGDRVPDEVEAPIFEQVRTVVALAIGNARLEQDLTEDKVRLAELEATVQNRDEELEAAHRELVRKERLATLGQLIATVSHELRNPLGTVRGSVFLISQRLLGKDLGVERALDRAERNIVRCDRIIEDLLDYTRTQDLELQRMALDRWLEIALEEYLFPADIEVSASLGVDHDVLMEPERLHRCLINLLNNACDAMKTKPGEAIERAKRLDVTCVTVEHRAEIRVTDSGCGIPAENLEKILEPLFSTKSFGVGLGLPTVNQIMEQHGGGLELESEVGRGTTATLWLPIATSGPGSEKA